tara:strand:- start:2074 stop:2463 length:390 start_codon:yes stop_codon:yes gene_type:complete
MKSKHKLMKRIFENQGMKVNFDSFGENAEAPHATASQELDELFGKRGLDKFAMDTEKEQKERIEAHKKAIADLEDKLQVASQMIDPRTTQINPNDPNAEEYFNAYQKQIKEIPAKLAQLKKDLKHLMRK